MVFMKHILSPDMMPALHNYITVDPDTFLGNPRNMEIIYDMCKTVSDWKIKRCGKLTNKYEIC